MKLHYLVNSIRTRITLWHLCMLVVILLVYMGSVQWLLWRQLLIEFKGDLWSDTEIVENYLLPAANDTVVWGGHDASLMDDGLKRFIEVRTLDGALIYRNFTETNLYSSIKLSWQRNHELLYHAVTSTDGEDFIVAQAAHLVANQKVNVFVGRSKGYLFNKIGKLFAIQLLGFPLALILSWVGGYIVAGRILSPLRQIVERVKTISADRLHERLLVKNPNDELGHLSITLNELLEKLDHSFSQMRQFTADASHELRTPLSAIRSVGEVALRNPRSEISYRDTLVSMLEEVDRMSRLVNDLLLLARSDNGRVRSDPKVEDLGEIVTDVVALLRILAEEKNQDLVLEIVAPSRARIDRKIFRQAVSNILHNAIKYTPREKEIRIRVGKEKDGCYVEITDQGPGIKPEHRDRIFDRFFREDKVRSRQTGGTGLGLAIAKWAVEIHGGHIDLNVEPGNGCCFKIWLPEPT